MLTIDQNNPIANSISTFGTLVDSEAIFVITRNVFTAITVVYYLAWFLPRLKQHGLKAALWMWKIICGVRDRDTRNKASQASRALLHRRLTNDPLPFTVQILTVLRFAVVGAFFWRWWRIRQEHSVADIASIYEPYGSLILGIVGVAYLQFATSAMRATLNTPRPTENQTNLSRALSKTLTDRLFAFSICDIVFITICSMCVPGHTSQAHLAFIVPIMTAWLFRSEVKAIVLWLLISISVSGQWYWAFVLTHNTSGPTYLQTVLPQLVFWALLCAAPGEKTRPATEKSAAPVRIPRRMAHVKERPPYRYARSRTTHRIRLSPLPANHRRHLRHVRTGHRLPVLPGTTPDPRRTSEPAAPQAR